MKLVSRRLINTPIAGCLLLTLAACSPMALIDRLIPETGYEREQGISYGEAPRQKLDIYRPANGLKSRTVIVFLYGGAWKSGHRGGYRFVGQTFAARGYVTVIPDYRLFPEVRFPRFVEDAADAIAWVRREIATRGGDPDRIVIMGHSAGAHSAALLALDRTYFDKVGVPQDAVVGWVGLAGPYAFDPFEYNSTRPIFETASEPDATRPIKNVRAGAAPALLLHGFNDLRVNIRNSIELSKRLREAGIRTRFVTLEDTGHSGVLLGLAKPFMGDNEVIDPIIKFIESLDNRATAGSN